MSFGVDMSKHVCLSVTRQAPQPWCDHNTPEYPGSREASRRTLQGRWLHHWSWGSSYTRSVSLPMLFASVGVAPLWMFSHYSRMGTLWFPLQAEYSVSTYWHSKCCEIFRDSDSDSVSRWRLRYRSFNPKGHLHSSYPDQNTQRLNV